MERKSSKEYSVIFLVEGEKFKYEICPRGVIFVVFSAATLEFAAFSSGPEMFLPNLRSLLPKNGHFEDVTVTHFRKN